MGEALGREGWESDRLGPADVSLVTSLSTLETAWVLARMR